MLAWALVVIALGVYWTQLLHSHRAQFADAEAQTRLRATQTAQALALQIGALVGGIDYLARNLGDAWLAGNPARFRDEVRTATAHLPAGALVQVSVADRSGVVVYSSLEPGDARGRRVSIADREHFRAHGPGRAAALYISEPVHGRVSRRWSVQFSRPLLDGADFAGVVVVSISPEYLSRSFQDIFPDDDDVVELLRSDGSYLARSFRLDEVLGRRADAVPAAVGGDAAGDGIAVQTGADGVLRLHAWHRVAGRPLLIGLGLDRARALAPLQQAIRASVVHNVLGSLLLLVAAGWISVLFLVKRRHAERLAETGERLALVLRGGDLGSWDWDIPSGRTRFDERWAQMLGYRVDELASEVSTWQRLVHPDDWAPIRAVLDAHLRGDRDHYESEHRLRHRDGRWIWVLDRGQIVARDADGRPQRMVGTHLDITARKEAEAVRSEYRERLAKLVAEVPGAVFQFLQRPDGSACFPYASPGIEEIYGVGPAQAALSADAVFAALHPDDRDRVADSIRLSAARLSTWSCEYRVRLADGAVRWLHGQAKPERTADGGTLWHGYIHDVTESHAAADALRLSEARLRLTVAAVRDGLWEWDMRSGTLAWDARCFEILGHAEGAIPMSFDAWVALLHPADRERTLVGLHSQVARQSPDDDAAVASDEFRMRTASGDWLWVEGRGRVVGWDGAQPVRMIGTYTDISRRVTDAQVRRALLDQSAAAIFLASAARVIVDANARALELFAGSGAALVGSGFRAMHVSEASYLAFGRYYPQLAAAGRLRLEYPLRDATGQTRWFDVSGTLLDPEQPDGNVIWTLVDVTEGHLAQEALATERLRLTTLLERFPGGVLVEDARSRVVMANQSLCELLGLACTPDELVGCDQRTVRAAARAVALDWLRPPAERRGAGNHRTIEVPGADGRTLEIDWVPIERERDDLGHFWLVRDITERKQRETMLATLAATDALTGLPNRRAFMASLEQAMCEPAVDPGRRGVLLMMDIDHFKHINDSHGHPVGDRVLQHVAEVMRHSLRRNDVAGRLGGEEFAVLLPGTSAADGLMLAERLRSAIGSAPMPTEAGTVAVTVSVGLCPLDGGAVKDVMRRADEALYVAKGAGRNRVLAWTD